MFWHLINNIIKHFKIVLILCLILSKLFRMGGHYYFPYFTEEEIEAQSS